MKVRILSLTCEYLIENRIIDCLPCCYQGELHTEYQYMLWRDSAEKTGFENLSHYLKLWLANDIKVVGIKRK